MRRSMKELVSKNLVAGDRGFFKNVSPVAAALLVWLEKPDIVVE